MTVAVLKDLLDLHPAHCVTFYISCSANRDNQMACSLRLANQNMI